MPNLHNSGPDTLAELESIDYDLLPACILATSGLTTPGSGLTLAAVSATGYVRLGTALYYVAQPAISVTVSSTAGNHWLALTTDTYSAIAGWTRRAGSHFVEQANATQPTAPDGAQLVASITVTAGNVTAVTALPSPPLSRQNANAVAITGGTALNLGQLTTTGPSTLAAQVGIGRSPDPSSALAVSGDALVQGHVFATELLAGTTVAQGYPLYSAGNAYIGGGLTVNVDATVTRDLRVTRFSYLANNTVIGTPAETATYTFRCNGTAAKPGGSTWTDTASMRALKRDIQPLAGALRTLLGLKGRTWRWAEDQPELEALLPGRQVGLVIDEIAPVLPQWVETHADGTQSYTERGTLAFVVEAFRELVARVEQLEARLAQP